VRIAVFGMGYVGTVTAAVLAQQGHSVVGIEVDPLKVARLQAGTAPFREPGLDDVLADVSACGSLEVTRLPEAARDAGCFLICVGTPSLPDGSADLRAVQQVAGEIGRLLRRAAGFPVVVLRSTVPPPAISGLMALLEQASNRRLGRDFGF
jgi:GDP-mannose 6-dehydrogenase